MTEDGMEMCKSPKGKRGLTARVRKYVPVTSSSVLFLYVAFSLWCIQSCSLLDAFAQGRSNKTGCCGGVCVCVKKRDGGRRARTCVHTHTRFR